MQIRPKSIRGKLLFAFLLATMPVLGVQIADHVHSFRQAEGTVAHNCNLWLAASIAAALLGMVLLFATGNRMSRPVGRLARAAQALAVGDFRKRVRVRTGDELEVLAESFNSLGESLAAREAELRGQAEVLAGMAEAAGTASATLNPNECARAIAKTLCSHLGAEAAAIFLKDPAEGGVKLAAYCHERPSAACTRLAAHVASGGDYLVMAERDDALLAGIPLISGDSAAGAIIARYVGVPKEDLQIGGVRADALAAFGIHAAAAIANAQAYSRSESYSGILEDWVEHLSSVMQVTDAISPALNLQEALETLANETFRVMNADACAILLPNQDGNLVMQAVKGWLQRVEDIVGTVLSVDHTESGIALKEKRHVTCRDVLRSNLRQAVELGMRTGLRGLLSVPMLFRDQSIGAVTVLTRAPRDFTHHEIRLLTSIGLHAAVIVRNARLYTREAAIAEALQQGLVSIAPKRCGPLKLAGKYVPAFDEARVGGDFYDVIEMEDGRVFVVMADVSGKGLSAAIHLAETKYMLRAIVAQHAEDPGRVLRELNHVMNRCPDLGFFVTAFCMVIDTKNYGLRYASAGHPPALLISRHGQMHTCLNSTGIPVGTGYSHKFPAQSVDFQPADTLLLYTDGVTESRIAGEELGLEGLHKLVFEAGHCEAEELVSRLCAALIDSGRSNHKDDVALLAVEFEPCTERTDEAAGGQNGRKQSIAA